MLLIRPTHIHLASYISALEQGWSWDNSRPAAADDELDMIRANAGDFLASMDDPEAKGPPITLPDGSVVPRLPGIRRWMWDGEFAGNIGLRWQHGTTALSPTCLGHIGYSVVPWKQRNGYATKALRLILAEAKEVGLPFVEITTDPENLASQRAIEANGGELFEKFIKPPQCGGKPGLRYRIAVI